MKIKDRKESIATIHEALEKGVTLFDTGDFYGMGHNELLLREALQGQPRENAFISVKFGALRSPDGGWIGMDNRPQAVKNFLSYTLQRLEWITSTFISRPVSIRQSLLKKR